MFSITRKAGGVTGEILCDRLVVGMVQVYLRLLLQTTIFIGLFSGVIPGRRGSPLTGSVAESAARAEKANPTSATNAISKNSFAEYDILSSFLPTYP
jgi:hypothetical protein